MDTILSFFTATEYLIERCVQTQEWKNVENAFLNLPTEIEHSICYKWRSLWMVWIHELRCSMQDLVCMIVGVHEYVLLLRRRWSDMKIVAKIVEHASTFHRSPTTKFCFMDLVSSICSKTPNLIRDICESTQSNVTQLGKCGYLTSWTWLPSDSKTNRNKWIQSLLDPRVHLNGDHICLPIVQKMSDFWRCCLNHWIQSWGQDCWSLILIRSFIWLRSNWSNCLGSVPR
jgi:hypothetical protein